MFRSIFGLKFFARPRSSGDMDSSKKKSKRRSERPSSPEDLNPPTILREHGRRGERPSSSGGTNPSTIMKERRQKGESPLSCAENKPSITRQQERRDVSSLFSVGTNPSTIMKEHRQKGESPLSCAENKPSTTRQQERKDVSSLFYVGTNMKEHKRKDVSSLFYVGTNRKEHRRKGESPLSCAENKPSTTRQQIRRGESPSSSSSEDKQPSTPRRKQAWRGESPPSSSSEDDQPSSTRQRVRRFESPPSSSSEDKQPSTPRRQQERRAESPLSINLSVRKERKIIEREKQRLEKDGLKRERERCEKMKRKNQEKETKTFGLLSRIYIWRLNRKIDRLARKIQSTHVDECYLLRHGPLINPKEMAEKEQLLDQRRDLILYKRRQEFKVEKEVRKQRLKVERKEIDVKKMENISELCCNSDSPDMLNLGYGPMPVRSPKLRFVNIYHLREYESNQKNGIKQREVIEGDGKHFRFDKTEVKRRQAWV
ncbi:hepatoma-derived growth factor-related protein 2-like [Sander lucioperca]|uniref:hepatoma-derived growth factor-related protein 2-like n=1 Tax=Sander lucioperca TaxID=283035 RepID=UPI00125DF9E7|nr:hepatoma-derived growth factor-related protein 2-like [Sander lucioperca]